MKTLKITIAAIALLFTGVAANAVGKPNSNKPGKEDVVNAYVNAISTGNTKSLDKILENDMQFNLKRGDNVNTITKETLLDGMVKNPTAVQPVKTSITVMQDDDNSEKVKIVFNYSGYVRTDIVTLDRTYGWAINNVTSSSN